MANGIGNHLFGNKESAATCRNEAKCADPINFKDELSDVRLSLKKVIDDLAGMCTLIGV